MKGNNKTAQKKIIVNITYPGRIGNISIQNKDILVLFSNQKLDDAFRNFALVNNLKTRIFYFYLTKDNQPIKEFQKGKLVSELGISENDNILVSDKPLQVKEEKPATNNNGLLVLNQNKLPNEPKYEKTIITESCRSDTSSSRRSSFSLKQKNGLEEENDSQKKKNKKIILIIIFIALGLIALAVGITFLVKYLLNKDVKIFEEEKLVAHINYQPNTIFRYINKKKTHASTDGKGIDESQLKILDNYTQLIEFFFIIREKNYEVDNNSSIKKNWYTGYLGILNTSVNNGTNIILLNFDETLNKYIYNGTDSQEVSEEDLVNTNENKELNFVKFDFYENGEIKNIYLPDNFDSNNTKSFKEIINLIIPKISSNLYQENISNAFNQIYEDLYKTDNDTDSTNENESENGDEEKNELKLKYIYKLKDSPATRTNSQYRKLLESSNTSSFFENGTLVDPEELTVEEYYTSSSGTISYDLREATNNNGSDTDLNQTNSTNLTQYSVQGVDCDEFQLENSLINTSVYTKINENGFLESLTEIKKTTLSNEKFEEEDEDEPATKNDLGLNFTNMNIESSNFIDLTGYYSNDGLNKKLYKYFDSFNYQIYYENNKNETYLRNLKEKEKIMKLNNLKEDEIITEYYNASEKRKLSSSSSSSTYYGLETTTKDKSLYKYNILGLTMKKSITNELDPSTGISTTYFVMTFGKSNKKFKMDGHQTNMHITTENKNQMAYNLITLLYESYLNIAERNKKYLEVILEIEKNITNFLENDYDFSGLIRGSMNDMYDQVKNFTGEFFNELIKLIYNVYDNYTVILENVKKENYDNINQIRVITKNEYLKYINNMIDLLEVFQNTTLSYLDSIRDDLETVDNFQIDVLYDITESLYDGKLIVKKFTTNLFKSIEKGILTFKYDIKDYIDEIIGDLLYITEFLSVNINKNEILKQAFDEETRNEVSSKLKNFKNTVITIFDLLIENINKDYDNEMSVDKGNSIKFISEQKAKTFLNNIENNSNDLINQIKLKITYMDLYELYSDNIDNINDILNKTFIEFINDTCYYLSVNISNIKPEYLNKNSTINTKKQKSQKISKNLTNYLNNEIREINEYIINYTEKYKENNIYNMYYNLYNFKKRFSKQEMENLLNQFYSLISDTFNVILKPVIDYNYNLGKTVLDEEFGFFLEFKKKARRLIGEGFLNRFNDYKGNFYALFFSINSSDLLNAIKKYFLKINNDIINYVNSRINKINKYYFNNGKNTDNFYFIDQMNNEISTIIDILNTYINEMNSYTPQTKAQSIFVKELKPYFQSKYNALGSFYDNIFNNYANHKKIQTNDNDFCYSKHRLGSLGYKNYYRNCSKRGNLNKLSYDFSKTDSYLQSGTNKIISNFIKRFDNYLNNYIILSQKFFDNLYSYVNEKINNNKNIELILFNYQTIYNEILNEDSNYALYQKLISNNYNNNIFIESLENNVNLIKGSYFNIHYLNDYSRFLEYPDEIIYKINQFTSELLEVTEYIKEKINSIFEKKIINIITSTNLMIKDLNSFNLKYILTHIDANDIYNEYITSKFKFINQIFSNYDQQLIYKYNEYTNTKKNNFFNEENYNTPLDKIINNYKDFASYFENVTIQNFTVENCTKILVADNSYTDKTSNKLIENKTYDEKCEKIIKQSELNYSKYNFNIVKLRTGIYYTKTLIENLESIFDELEYNDIIDINQINEKDELLNDKNILNFYNDTLNELKIINKESLSFIDEPYESFIGDFDKKFNYKNDYSPFIEKFQQIITLKDEYYNNNITNRIKETQNNINILLNNFNNTLYDLLIDANSYTYYNFNKTNFDRIYKDYSNLIDNSFYQYSQNIATLDKRGLFNYSLIKVLDNLQIKKRNYYQKIVNDFAKNYNFEFLNVSYNLGEKCNSYMKKKYDEYKFNYKYNFVELFEKNNKNYIKNILSRIKTFEKNTKEKFKSIYENFYKVFNTNSRQFVNYQYIKDLKINYTSCINYSYDLLNETLEKDLINYQKFKNYTELINFINTNCPKISADSLITDNNKQNNTDQIPYQCLLNISKIPVVEYFNETEHLLNCYNNNYYNYSATFIEDFNEVYKTKMNNIIENITLIIKNNYINEEFLYDYLQIYELPDYNTSVDDIYYNFEDFENMINYANYNVEDKYKNFLYNSLLIYFKKSYQDFVNNYVIEELIDNITILINSKLEFNLKYMQNKITDEYNYYLVILNKMDEVGKTTKSSFTNLYEKLNKKLNESLYYLIEDDIYFYLTMFYRENKKQFMNNFYNHMINLNEDSSIFKLSKYLEEIILEKDLNKSLIEISSNLLNETIVEKLKTKLKTFADGEKNTLFNLNDKTKENIKNILDKKGTQELNENMIPIYNKVIKYTDYVDNFSNRFMFIMGNKPFNLTYEFVKDVLEPPLLLIKNKYNTIEEKLLEGIIKLVNNFPNYLEILESKTDCTEFLKTVNGYYSILNNTMTGYTNEFSMDLESYINKLVHYTYINGLEHYTEPCTESYCMIDLSDDSTRRVSEINNNKNKTIIFRNYDKYIKKNKNKNSFKRKLSEYTSSMGATTKEEVLSYLPYIQEALYDFNASYLSKEFKSIKRTLTNFITKMNTTYLFKLKRSISMVALKFSTILTNENYLKMENQVYKQYNNIERYINNNSYYIDLNINYFVKTLNASSIMLKLLYDLTCNNTIEYYDLFNHYIDDKVRQVTPEEVKSYNSRLLKMKTKDSENLSKTKNLRNQGASEDKKTKHNKLYNSKEMKKNLKDFKNNKKSSALSTIKNFIKDNLFENKDKDELSDHLSIEAEVAMELTDGNITSISVGIPFCYNVVPPLKNFQITIPPFPALQLEISPGLFLGFCFEIGYEHSWEDGVSNVLSLDIYGKAEISIEVRFGVVVDLAGGESSSSSSSGKDDDDDEGSGLELFFGLGITGTIFQGQAGIQFVFYFNENRFTFDVYFVVIAFEFEFYVSLEISLEVGIVSFSYKFYFYRKTFMSLVHNEDHNIIEVDFSGEILDIQCKPVAKNFKFKDAGEIDLEEVDNKCDLGFK